MDAMQTRTRTGVRRGVVAAALVAVMSMLGATAFAVATGFGGSAMTSMRSVTQTSATFTQGVGWVNVPTAGVVIPARAGDTLRARFSGETTCVNVEPAGLHHCRARIVLVNAAGAVVEFHPQSGNDYLWDNTFDGRAAEAHAQERLLKVPTSGNWVVRVQYNSTSNVTRHVVDDWTFTVDTIAP